MTVGGGRGFESQPQRQLIKTMRDTSKFVAEKIVGTNTRIKLFGEYNILEPSAGTGTLAKEIKRFFLDSNIDCVELNKEKFDQLKLNFSNAIHADFLEHTFDKKYDFIFAAPPFKGNIDLKHIMKMYDLLGDDGEISSLTSPYWLTNNEPLQVEFRAWLKDKKHKLEMLPDLSFSERDKTVPTALITIWKQ